MPPPVPCEKARAQCERHSCGQKAHDQHFAHGFLPRVTGRPGRVQRDAHTRPGACRSAVSVASLCRAVLGAYHKTLSPSRNQFSRFLVGCLILLTVELGAAGSGGQYGLFLSQIASGSLGLPQPSRGGAQPGHSRPDDPHGRALGQTGRSCRR